MPADPVCGRQWADHRRTLEAIAWKYRTNSPWRASRRARLFPDRPQAADQMGPRRHLGDDPRRRPGGGRRRRRRRLDGVGGLHGCPGPPTRCRSAQRAAHCEPADHALGRSRGGLSTKVHLAADGRARPLAFTVTAGQAGDAPAFETVMSRIRVPRRGPGRPRTRPLAVLAVLAVLADRAYSSRAIRSHLRRRGIRAVIPQPSARLRPRGLQAAEHRRAVHQPPQAVARPGHANRQTHHRLPGRTPPRRHPHLDPTLIKETEPSRRPARPLGYVGAEVPGVSSHGRVCCPGGLQSSTSARTGSW